MGFKVPDGEYIAWDTETTGLSWRKGDQVYSISFCNAAGETSLCHFPVDPYTRNVKYRNDDLKEIFKFFSDPTRKKIAHNAQFDRGMTQAMLSHLGEIVGPFICTMSLIRLCDSSANLKLKPFAERLGIPTDDEKKLRDITRRQRAEGKKKGWKIFKGKNEDGSLAPDYWLAGPDHFGPYNVMDSVRAMATFIALSPDVQDERLKELWKNEQQVWKFNRQIEDRGIRISRKKTIRLKKKAQTKQNDLIQNAFTQAGEKFNFRSPQQLSKILYNRLQQPVKFFTATDNPSTSMDALYEMKHPLAKTIIQIRECEGLIKSLDQYFHHMVWSPNERCYLIHPNISQSIPITGRESISNPSLQNASKDSPDSITKDFNLSSRYPFVPRKEHCLRSYDWKNIEVYIPAFESNDKILTRLLLKGKDTHQYTADRLKITRTNAKTVWFGLQYGIGPAKLARQLEWDEDQAYRLMNQHRSEYAGFWSWVDKLKYLAMKKGYVETRYGRRTNVHPDFIYRCVNYFVQPTAADILKFSKVRVMKKISKKFKAWVNLPIHDEMLVEHHKDVPTSELDAFMVENMQDNPQLEMAVKIPVSISYAHKSWAHKTEVK